jgi:hypothetical protein
MRHVTDTIDELNARGTHGFLEWHNFESRNDENELPKHTLVGLDGFSFDENGGLWAIRVALAVSSYRDLNLLDEIELIDAIHGYFYEGAKIKLLNMDNGDEVSELVISNFSMLPMAQSEIRNYRTIGLEVKRTEIAHERGD